MLCVRRLSMLLLAAGLGYAAACAHHHPGYSLSRRWNAFQRHHLHKLAAVSGGRYLEYRHGEPHAADCEWGPERQAGAHHDGVGEARNITSPTRTRRRESVHGSVGRAAQCPPRCGCGDVRLSSGTVIGPARPRLRLFRSATSRVWRTTTAVRPTEGAGYGLGRTWLLSIRPARSTPLPATWVIACMSTGAPARVRKRGIGWLGRSPTLVLGRRDACRNS